MNFSKPKSIFNFKLKPIATSITIGSILTLTACETNSTSVEQEDHLEPVAIALQAHDESAYHAILFDKNVLPDSLDRKNISLKVDETVELDVVALCISSGVMSPCTLSTEKHDHDHDEEKHDDHDDEEHDDHDGEEHDDHDDKEHDDHDREEHDDHDDKEHDDHDGEEHDDHDDKEKGEFTLKTNLSDSSIVELTTEADHFEVAMKGLKAGQTDLEVEIWHGSHADISNKIFEITVQD